MTDRESEKEVVMDDASNDAEARTDILCSLRVDVRGYGHRYELTDELVDALITVAESARALMATPDGRLGRWSRWQRHERLYLDRALEGLREVLGRQDRGGR